MNKIVAAILVDALRHDSITKKYTPFLHSLSETGVSGSIIPQLSFSLHPAWFAGVYPNDSAKWGYYYSPRTSPFTFLKPLSPIAKRSTTVNKMCNVATGKLFHFSGTLALYLPMDVACYFDFSDKNAPWDPNYLTQTTLFDILRKNNLEWLFIGSPGSNQSTHMILRRFSERISQKISFLWLHFAEVDWMSHEFGPRSSEAWKSLNEVDLAICEVVKKLNENFKDVHLLVFGDHGMVTTKATVDIEVKLRKTGLKPCRDYLFFLGATMARFWFNADSSRSMIQETLNQTPYGRILEEKELADYGCNFNDLRYGDTIWVANEGTIISPNFYNGSNIPKGMHGFTPNSKNSHAAFLMKSSIISESLKLKNPRKLVDLFPTILDMMGLSTPASNKGKSIFTDI